MKFHIAMDLRATNRTGVYRYGMSLARSLLSNPASSNRLFFLVKDKEQAQDLARGTNFQSEQRTIVAHDDYEFVRDSPWVRNWLLENSIDLYYSVHYIVDIFCPTPFVYTIHDLTRLKFPEYSYNDRSFIDKFGVDEFTRLQDHLAILMSETEQGNILQGPSRGIFLDYFMLMSHYLSRRSDCIVTVSPSAARDITQLLGVPYSKIQVVSGAADNAFLNTPYMPFGTQVLEKHQISDCYCIYVGLAHPHKRLGWLIEAFYHCINQVHHSAQFVVVGDHHDRLLKSEGMIAELVRQNRVVVTGRVTDAELAFLYSQARALVVSSISEGFCLPSVEALACHCEVIAPDIEVLRDTIGVSGHFYPAQDEAALCDLLIRAYSGRLENRAGSFVNPYSWAKSSARLWQFLVEVGRRRGCCE